MVVEHGPHERHHERVRVVEEHIRCENEHDLDGIMATFSDHAEYDDSPWDEHHRGRDAVRAYYDGLLTVLPDLGIEVHRRYIADEAIVLEVTISGTHLATWRGVPATGRHVEFPVCAVYTFGDGGRLAGERIYYDRMEVLAQLGLSHGPDTLAGRLGLVLGHPVTMARAVARALSGRHGGPA